MNVLLRVCICVDFCCDLGFTDVVKMHAYFSILLLLDYLLLNLLNFIAEPLELSLFYGLATSIIMPPNLHCICKTTI